MSQMTARPDPAPSRLKYRMERLMLTPLFRLLLRFGLPRLARRLRAIGVDVLPLALGDCGVNHLPDHVMAEGIVAPQAKETVVLLVACLQ